MTRHSASFQLKSPPVPGWRRARFNELNVLFGAEEGGAAVRRTLDNTACPSGCAARATTLYGGPSGAAAGGVVPETLE
jgi:hypothetical protein